MMDYEKLARRHKDHVYRHALRVCGNREDAEDVLVDALVAAYRSLDQLRDDAAFRSWLAKITLRLCGRMRRREALAPVMKFSELELDPSEASAASMVGIDEQVARRTLHECIQTAIAGLPDNYREVYMMREIEGLTAEETARRLGLTVPNVKSRLHRARNLMRETLDRSLCQALVA